MSFEAMMERAKSADGFLAALDQSGGSTPKALKLYGVPDDVSCDSPYNSKYSTSSIYQAYVSGEESMYEMVHAMRSRIITAKPFTGEKVLGAILFENTMDREIEGIPTGQYLWEKKDIIPFIKIDKGLADEENGVQLMKPIPGLEDLLKRAKSKGFFGTKMRSVINSANEEGIKAIVDQQFAVGKQIISFGLVPIIEPEVNIKAEDKELCEDILKARIMEQLDQLGDDEKVMLKLTLPTKVNHYKDCIDHPKVVRVVALSGGYSRDEANEILAKQKGMIASFSRALAEGLVYGSSDEEYESVLAKSIDAIYEASKSG